MTADTLTFALGEHWIIDAAAEHAAGAALNLAGATAIEFRVASSVAELVRATLSSGITVVSAVAGTCQIVITPAMQSSVTAGRWRYQWVVTTSDGVVSEQASGPFIVTRSLKIDFP